MNKRHYHVLTAKTLVGLMNFEGHGFVILKNTIVEFNSLTATDDGAFANAPGYYNIAEEGFVAIGYKPSEQ